MRSLARPGPASFALVMATGIVSVAAQEQGFAALAFAGFAFAALAWIVLTAANAWRVVSDRDAVWSDVRDHARAPGFLTAVAGTAVLAGNVLLFVHDRAIATALAAWAAVLWLVITYGVFAALTTREDKPSLEKGLNGSWLLAVVASQSIAVVCAMLSPQYAQPTRLHLNFAALALWLAAGMLYIWIIGLIFYRYLFFRFAPSDLTPAYWINMGAMAISTLAGSLLLQDAGDAPLLFSVHAFIAGFTLLYWATATWWLPMLVALGVWRFAIHRDRFGRHAIDWSTVFPLGMYSAATYQMKNALQLEFLAPVASAFCWIAIAAWIVTAATRWMKD